MGHTAIAVQFYAPGLMVFCLAKVFVPAFYALQDTRTPFRLGLLAVTINFSLNVLFVLTWPEDIRHAGLAFATVISEGVNGLMLGFLCHSACSVRPVGRASSAGPRAPCSRPP